MGWLCWQKPKTEFNIVYQNKQLPRFALTRSVFFAAAVVLTITDHFLLAPLALEAGLLFHNIWAPFIRELRLDAKGGQGQLTDFHRHRVSFSTKDVFGITVAPNHASFRLPTPPREFVLATPTADVIRDGQRFADFLTQGRRSQ